MPKKENVRRTNKKARHNLALVKSKLQANFILQHSVRAWIL